MHGLNIQLLIRFDAAFLDDVYLASSIIGDDIGLLGSWDVDKIDVSCRAWLCKLIDLFGG